MTISSGSDVESGLRYVIAEADQQGYAKKNTPLLSQQPLSSLPEAYAALRSIQKKHRDARVFESRSRGEQCSLWPVGDEG